VVTKDFDTIEDYIYWFMHNLNVNRMAAYNLTMAKIEYDKKNHGKWNNNT